MRKPLRLGLLGTGVAARQLYLPAFRELAGRVQVVACANRTRRKAAAFAKQAGIPHVVADLDELLAHPAVEAIFVSLPIDAQPAVVLRCLAAGKPVLSEKPIAPDLATGRRLVQRASRCSTPWLIGENFEFMSHVRQAMRWIKSGKLGQVRLVEVRQLTRMNDKNPYFASGWRKEPKHVGGFVVDGGVHLAHVLRRCFGTPKIDRKLTAQFDPALPPLDTALGLLRFESGAVGTWTSCFSAQYTGPMLTAYGSKGTLEASYDRALLTLDSGRSLEASSEGNSFAAQLLHFKDVVQRGVAPAVPPEDALEDLRLVAALV